MKLYNILVDNQIHLAAESGRGIIDLSAAGFEGDMDELIRGGCRCEIEKILADESLPTLKEPVYANIMNKVGKLICVGLNYKAHAEGCDMKLPEYPILFSKFDNALAPANADIELPAWETSYDYEAELVIVMGKECWNVSEEEAMDCVFGYTCGNDLSIRDAQMRSGQWLIGKTMPGFGPCGPCIVTADEFDPYEGKAVRSYVNGQLRQDGSTSDMIFPCAKIIAYASKYIKLCPGDMIFTGTPSGVALEKAVKNWIKPSDVVDVEIEGIGRLTNKMI